MKKSIKTSVVRGLFILLAGICGIVPVIGQTYVDQHGQLSVSNGQLVDKSGTPIQLKGMSLFWSSYSEGYPYFNENTVNSLWTNYKCTVIRIPMAIAPPGGTGYETSAAEANKVIAVVDACIKYGIYAVIDFHAHDAPTYKAKAITFFSLMATRYKGVPNVLYETWNEPLGTANWSTVIKPYHIELIDTIRAIDPLSVILCGCKTYDQELDGPQNDPIPATNIMYTMHFYAGTSAHYLSSGGLGAKTKAAVAAKLPIFVTEYGTCDASGNGSYDTTQTRNWWNYLDANKISYCNWGIYDKVETAAALKENTSPSKLFTDANLTTSGLFVLTHVKAGYDGTMTPVAERADDPSAPLVFPNPSNTQFTINVAGNFTYTILDNAGKIVESGKGVDSQISGSALFPGSYIVTVESAKGKSFHKLIKN